MVIIEAKLIELELCVEFPETGGRGRGGLGGRPLPPGFFLVSNDVTVGSVVL